MTKASLPFIFSCFIVALSTNSLAQSAPCTDGQSSPDCRALPPKPARPAAEEMQKSMEAAMGSMVPMMGKMTEVTVEAQLKIAVMPETAERLATFKRNLFEQLQKKGFTPAQAMQITLTTPLPSGSTGK